MSNKANPAETLLKKIRKLDYNMSCPNCGTQAQVGVGFGNVCVKFKTFICDLCKTSHQAISHRVKSITMSNWTMDEVNELLDINHGGNRAAQHIWLANAPPIGGRYSGGSRPKVGDRVEIFKQFVLDAYEYGKFKATTPYQPAGDSASVSPVNSAPVTPKPAAAAAAAPVSRPPAVAAPPAAPAPSLLDDDFFSSSPSPAGSAFSQPGSAKSASNGAFSPSVAQVNFDPFASSAPSSSNNNQAFDPFATSSPAPSSSAAAFDPFGPSASSAGNVNNMFADMSFSASTAPAPTAAIRPPSIQQPVSAPAPAASAAPAFDPFGDTVLVPTTNSPPPAAAANNSVFGFGNQPQQTRGANAGSILDLYNTPTPGNNGVMQSGYRPNAGAASAISNLDGFGGPMGGAPRPMMPMGGQPMMNRGMAPMGGYGGMNTMAPMGGMGMGGMPNNGMMMGGGGMGGSNAMGAMNNNSLGISSMGGMGARPMMMGGGAGMGMNNGGMMNRGPGGNTSNASNNFDFVQDNMKMHLNNTGARR